MWTIFGSLAGTLFRFILEKIFRRDPRQEIADVKNDQIRAEQQRPRDRSELTKRLRDGKF